MANGTVAGVGGRGPALMIMEGQAQRREQNRRGGKDEAKLSERRTHPAPLRDFPEKKQLHSHFGERAAMVALTNGSTFSSLALAAQSAASAVLPDYPNGPLGLTVFRGQTIQSDPNPPASEQNVLLINSGGDCRGYNNINYGAYQELRRLGFHVFGSLNGPAGLTNPRPQIIELTDALMEGSNHEGELLLATGGRKKGPFDRIEGLDEGMPMANFLRNVGPFLGGILLIGGNGTLHMAERLFRETAVKKVLFAGASMDGDIPGLDGSVGMFSALDFAVGAVRSIRRTAASCNKIHIVQTMGGNSGRFPLEVSIAAGEEALLIPEIGKIPLQEIYEKLFRTLLQNRGAVLVIGETGTYRTAARRVVSFKPEKGLQNSIVVDHLARTVEREMKWIAEEHFPHLAIETRTTILGHVQRQPEALSNTDVRRGLDVGHRLGEALVQGRFGMMIPLREGLLVSLEYAVSDDARVHMEENVRLLWRRHFAK